MAYVLHFNTSTTRPHWISSFLQQNTMHPSVFISKMKFTREILNIPSKVPPELYWSLFYIMAYLALPVILGHPTWPVGSYISWSSFLLYYYVFCSNWSWNSNFKNSSSQKQKFRNLLFAPTSISVLSFRYTDNLFLPIPDFNM